MSAVTRRVSFALGVSVLPWLGGCLVAMGWAALGGSVSGMMRDLFGSGFSLLPLVVFCLVMAGTLLAEITRLEGFFASRFAVGGGVMVLSGTAAMVLGAVLAGEGGFVYAAMWTMFCGYPLFAFAAGSFLDWRSEPATHHRAAGQLT